MPVLVVVIGSSPVSGSNTCPGSAGRASRSAPAVPALVLDVDDVLFGSYSGEVLEIRGAQLDVKPGWEILIVANGFSGNQVSTSGARGHRRFHPCGDYAARIIGDTVIPAPTEM